MIDETNVVEMKAGVMKICCRTRNGIDEKNVAEMEAGNAKKLIFYFATNYPATNCPRRIARD